MTWHRITDYEGAPIDEDVLFLLPNGRRVTGVHALHEDDDGGAWTHYMQIVAIGDLEPLDETPTHWSQLPEKPQSRVCSQCGCRFPEARS